MVNEDVTALRRDLDKLMNHLEELGIDSLKEEIKKETIERDHPPGSPYFSFLVDDDPNDRYPGTTWVRIEENTYLLSAGPNLVGMTPVGSNTKNLTVSNLPNHNHSGSISSVSLTTNSDTHGHVTTYDTWAQAGTNRLAPRTGGGTRSSGATETDTHNHSINAHGHSLTINFTGSSESFDNRPKSLAVYMWRRIA